jgi:hypothetical protein
VTIPRAEALRWLGALLPDFIPWAGETFDYSTLFRKMLASIAEVLSQDAPTSIELPAYEDYDDPHVLRHSLSYLVLMSDSANTLRKIADRLASLTQIA